jgi:hypothetical protein
MRGRVRRVRTNDGVEDWTVSGRVNSMRAGKDIEGNAGDKK